MDPRYDVRLLRLRLAFVQRLFYSGFALAVGVVVLLHAIWVAGGILVAIGSALLAARIWILRRMSRTLTESTNPSPRLVRLILRSDLGFAIAACVRAVGLNFLLIALIASGTLSLEMEVLVFAAAALVTGWAAVIAYFTLRIRSIVLASSTAAVAP